MNMGRKRQNKSSLCFSPLVPSFLDTSSSTLAKAILQYFGLEQMSRSCIVLLFLLGLGSFEWRL